MGSSGSKESSRKRSARESWYAPMSRCASAPIHFVAEADCDCSPSTLDCANENKNLFWQGGGSSLESLSEAESADFVKKHIEYTAAKAICEPSTNDSAGRDGESKPRKRAAIAGARSRFSSTLIPVAEMSECGDADTAIEFKRLDEDEKLRKSPPIRTIGNQHMLDKSQSFTRVQGLDSCFTELKPLVWRKFFFEQEKQTDTELDLSRSNSRDENSLHMKQSVGSAVSSAKTSSETRIRSPQRSPSRCTPESVSKSPLMDPCSPVFDPSLLAKFEEAVDAVMLPQHLLHDDLVPRTSDERSPSSTSCNQACGLSKTNSGTKRAQSVHKENSSILSHELPYCDSRNTPCELDEFETRCPPSGDDKVVLYFTSLRGIRKTYDDCCVLRRILQGMGVRVDERDVWMHSQFREELTRLLGKQLQVPRLFIKGKYIGGVEESCQLHEDGLLADLVVGMQYFGTHCKTCEGCADLRFVPCFTCHGSCKVVNDSDQVMRCSQCNENGLMLCPLCR